MSALSWHLLEVGGEVGSRDRWAPVYVDDDGSFRGLTSDGKLLAGHVEDLESSRLREIAEPASVSVDEMLDDLIAIQNEGMSERARIEARILGASEDDVDAASDRLRALQMTKIAEIYRQTLSVEEIEIAWRMSTQDAGAPMRRAVDRFMEWAGSRDGVEAMVAVVRGEYGQAAEGQDSQT